MKQQFLTYIEENQLLAKSDKVLAAVSGGVDSMVLAELLVASGFDIEVAHVNYHLRGEEADKDAVLVRQWCDQNDVVFHLHDVDPATYDKQGSTQMIARDIRYSFFEKVRKERGLAKIATAHHSNDQLETVLMNLTRGSSLAGLTGIPLQRDFIIRPLLFASRNDILSYANSTGVKWREDASNKKNDYHRNQIRNEVIPTLEAQNPNLLQTFQDTLLRLRGAEKILEQAAQQYQLPDGSINTSWFQEDEAGLALLDRIIKPYGFNFADVKDLGKAISEQRTGALFMSSSHVINLDREKLIVRPIEEKLDACIKVHYADQQQQGAFTIRMKRHEGNSLPEHAPDTAIFDADLIEFPLTLRYWREGDFFYPLGMNGKKKVSDFMIDSKIPLTLKRDIPILLSSDEILWIVGYRMDDRFKVTDKTRHLLKISVSRHV